MKKIEYLYNNNNNLKYTMKAILFMGIGAMIFFYIMVVCIEKNIDDSGILIFSSAIMLMVFFLEILFFIIITLMNFFKRKQFNSIKNNGIRFNGTILMAYKTYQYRQHEWLWKDSGTITVSANNKTYDITDVDYNKEFKYLKQKLDDDFHTNRQNYSNLYEEFKKNGKWYKVDSKEITVEIYVLEDKAVADFSTIKFN